MSLTAEARKRDHPVAAILALLAATGLLFDGLNTMFGNALVCLGAAGMLAILLLIAPPPVRFWERAWPALALAAAAAGWAAIGQIGGGRFTIDGAPVAPDLGGSALVGYAGGVAALLCGAAAGARRIALPRFVDWLLLFGCLGIVLALALDGDAGGIGLWTGEKDARFTGTLGNANAAAAVYGGLAALALARALEGEDRLWRSDEPMGARLHAGGLWIALLVAAGGCLLTASRMGFVLAAVALAVVAGRAASRRQWKRRLVVVGGLLVVLAGLGLSALLVERFGRLPDEVAQRLLLWRHNAALVSARPWSGYGIGSFPSVNTRYLGDVHTAQAIWMTNSPHNVALRLLIDAGAPYLALLVLAAVVVVVQVVRGARGRGFNLTETGVAMAIVAILGSACVDLALEVPGVTALFMLYVGLLWGRALVRRVHVDVAPPVSQPGRGEAGIGRRLARDVEHRGGGG